MMTNAGEMTQLLSIPEPPTNGKAESGAVASQLPTMASDFGHVATGSNAGAQIVTHDLHVVDEKKNTSPLAKGLLVVGMLIMGAFGYLWIDSGEMPDLMTMLGLGEDVVDVPIKPVRPRPKPPVVDPPAPSTPPATASASVPKSDNIWNKIENQLGSDLPELGEPLTVDQEALYRDKLAHEFTYQRYQGVVDLAASHSKGSQDILREALESKKLWTRMRALIGLADLGEEISAEDVKIALGDAHSELRARFFKRFEQSPCTPGCYFIARATLPHLDSLGRAQVIRVISRESSAVRDLFLVAATYDRSELVRQSAAEALDKIHVDGSVYQEIKKVAEP